MQLSLASLKTTPSRKTGVNVPEFPQLTRKSSKWPWQKVDFLINFAAVGVFV
jgi:hypothetical protein